MKTHKTPQPPGTLTTDQAILHAVRIVASFNR